MELFQRYFSIDVSFFHKKKEKKYQDCKCTFPSIVRIDWIWFVVKLILLELNLWESLKVYSI